MPNQLKPDRSCSCGGTYNHLATQQNKNGTFTDSFQCGSCETWWFITFRGEEEIGRVYEEPGEGER